MYISYIYIICIYTVFCVCVSSFFGLLSTYNDHCVFPHPEAKALDSGAAGFFQAIRTFEDVLSVEKKPPVFFSSKRMRAWYSRLKTQQNKFRRNGFITKTTWSLAKDRNGGIFKICPECWWHQCGTVSSRSWTDRLGCLLGVKGLLHDGRMALKTHTHTPTAKPNHKYVCKRRLAKSLARGHDDMAAGSLSLCSASVLSHWLREGFCVAHGRY